MQEILQNFTWLDSFKNDYACIWIKNIGFLLNIEVQLSIIYKTS